MRLFVAAELPDGVLEALAETSARLRGAVSGRFVPPDSFHVTLAFLGEVENTRVDSVTEALEQACVGFAPIDVSLGELGSFGRRAAATVWQGFSHNDGLARLAQSIRQSLHDADISFDTKPFRAHVTLMRGADVRTGELPLLVRAQGTIECVTLFKSDLSGSRPVYEALYTRELV